jgi:O-antigen ligase
VILLEQRVSPRFPRLFNLRAFTTWLLLLTLTLGVVFSYSRAAWGNFAIAVIVTLAVLSMRRRGARRVLHAGLLLLLVAAVVITVLSAAGSIHFLEQRAHLQSYDTERFSAQSFGWRLGWTHPLGVGPGQFELLSPVATHSTFVRTFAEQGWIGLLLWISLLLVTLVLALRNVVVGRDTYGIGSAALLGAWCGLIFNSTVVDTLHWRHLWVVAALIWASTGRSQATSAPARQPSSVAARPRLATSGATLR